MHRDLAVQVEHNPSANLKAEQAAIDKFRQEFNHVRPHGALAMKTPAEVFLAKQQKRNTSKHFLYPDSWLTFVVTKTGSIRFRGETTYFSDAVVG